MHALNLPKVMVKNGLYMSQNEVGLRPKEVQVVKMKFSSTT